MFRIEETNTALEPNIEKVTQIRIRNIIIVGWISDYCI